MAARFIFFDIVESNFSFLLGLGSQNLERVPHKQMRVVCFSTMDTRHKPQAGSEDELSSPAPASPLSDGSGITVGFIFRVLQAL